MTRAQARRLSGRLVDFHEREGSTHMPSPPRWTGEPGKIIGASANGFDIYVGWADSVGWIGPQFLASLLFDGPQGCTSVWCVSGSDFDLLPPGAAVAHGKRKRGGRS